MNAVRKLSIVDCPMPEAAIKPVIYGAAPWSRLPHTPPAHEINVRYRAQSLLSRDGQRAELPDYETALRIIADANRPKRVTVPPPLPPCAISPTSPPSGRVGRQSMAVNAQADARVQQGLSQESFEPKSAACTAKRLRRDSATNAGYKHRSLPPYLNTLAGDPAKDQA